MSQSSKKDLQSAYLAFIKSAAGQDFLQQAEKLEKAFILQGIQSKDNDGKAHAICKMEGLATLRDYMIRMSKA